MKREHLILTLQRACMVVLSVYILFSLPITLSAENAEAQDSIFSATVIAVNTPAYTIEIPQSIGTDQLYRTDGSATHTEEFEISISDVSFLNGRKLCVRLYSEDGTFNLYHTDTGDALPYLVYGPMDENTPMVNGDVFAYYTEQDAEKVCEGRIVVDQKDIRVGGDYEGSLKFSVSIVDESVEVGE